ncbi:MAG: hypothetical protein GWM90_32995, partial [Gemmatimonadetes bacterium]|nr:hypothetical protein [Gemmatimonadota bacterium]NIR42166.1 hypothetical protein [Actinomycetota bacterium]NIU80343.1 hypothetical protein [Gammaproteobacteria bacterium]NIQ60129.1 hypothetical protein [Gemmatimonadota bacterium]NIX48702.1 hypothetical protein [Gemmatimonadota bacterium]
MPTPTKFPPILLRRATGLVAVAVFGTAGAAIAQDGDLRTVDLEMYLELESVSDPQISPDGTEIV